MNDDVSLLERLSTGDRHAFTELYQRYQPKLSRYLLPFTGHANDTADEIVQDVFVKLWLKRETLAGLQRLEYYLYRMARNRMVDIFRHEKSRRQHDARAMEAAGDIYQLEDELKYREYHQLAREAIALMPERRRQIFELSTQRDLSWAEIADNMNLSVAVVKKQLHLASRSVKEYIARHGDIILFLLLCFL
ncbi:RNA polymerase sigma factor [Chitinophaga flava]|uniref:RNA polymerase sigma-70 factor n=1 Tax=Chitinophaga flava TaxID=2259036 RepID=A0A365XRH3_9BACT|nr:RNA polymerase sigma-70 factor [Chitinophaga flava]RBL88943.1 hypothetical protein DF182_20575 [Chitinophaga flava]